MKQEIDLTSNHVFNKNPKQYKANYYHRYLPWYPEDDENKPAKLKKEHNKINYDNITMFRNFNSWINDFTNTINISSISDSTMMYSTISNRTFQDTLTSYMYYYSDDSFVSYDLKTYTSNIYDKEPKNESHGFMVGYAKDIRARKLNQKVKSLRKYVTCNECNETTVKFPWTQIDYTYVCESCREKEKHKKIYHNRKFYNKLKNHKMTTVPCLSSNIKKIPKMRCQYDSWGIRVRNVISQYYDVYDENKYHINESDNRFMFERKVKTVYEKNHKLVGREQPWQPKGRVRQEYDNIFDSLDWRKMIKNYVKTH